MIKTFYGIGMLDSTAALFTALVIGFFFGLALERAGFGSSRRLAGVFYFRDMSVVKVMFSALITAALGLACLERIGLIDPGSQIYHMPTYYGAYIIAGILFGIGFVMAGWCPGTAAVGLASGKIDAFVFLAGGIIGSVVFNELYPVIRSLQSWGQSNQSSFGIPGLAFAYDSVGISKSWFLFLFSVLAVGCFWGVEIIERTGKPRAEEMDIGHRRKLQAVSVGVIMTGLLLLVLPGSEMGPDAGQPVAGPGGYSTKGFLTGIEGAEDHVEPETLATLLYSGDPGVLAVDVRPAREFSAFHIRGAVNVALTDLPGFADRNRDKRMLVLYSNGMTHPAQARDELFRMGYRNIYILTDGLMGFKDYCLKPASLRSAPVTDELTMRIRGWREFFLASPVSETAVGEEIPVTAGELPGLVDTGWLHGHLQASRVKIIDCRDQNDYNRGHIPGAVAISCESFRGAVNGVPSVLLPASLLATKMSLLNIDPMDTVVLVYGGDRIRDATLIAMALARLGHKRYGILAGGMDKWTSENLPVSTHLPPAGQTNYPMPATADSFTVDSRQTLAHMKRKNTVILDVRPAAYFSGEKSDEARAGHIPGARNREYKNDLHAGAGYVTFKPDSELAAAYAGLIPLKNSLVIVHCRTGHQASQTFFVLKYLLGYQHVLWYDAGWTEWAATPELPVETGVGSG